MSNSAANEWCASAGAARAASVATSAAEMNVCRDIESPRIGGVGILPRNLLTTGRPRRIAGLELAVEQRLGELHAIELEQPRIGLGAPIERHADRPRPAEGLRILDRRLVLHHVLVDERVTLRDDHRRAVVIAGAVEPRLLEVRVDLDDERVAVPRAVR